MTVGELKKQIESLPDDMIVICQKDAEGNGYSPCAGADHECIYVAENTWSGNIFSTGTSAKENNMDFDEWESLKMDGQRALVFFPIN